jgi:hypothetical protein
MAGFIFMHGVKELRAHSASKSASFVCPESALIIIND